MKYFGNQACKVARGFVVFTLAILINSCSSTTAPNNNSPNSTSNIVHPKLGTTFIDSSYDKDTNFNIVPSSGSVIVYTLHDTNATIAGQTNVFEFTSPVDTFYLHYESNGDVSNYTTFAVFGLSVGTEWVKLPAESQGTVQMTPITTSLGTDTIGLTGTAQGQGTETATVSGQQFSSEKTLVTADAYSHVVKSHTTGTVHSSFAPALGFLTKYDLSIQGNYLGYNLNSGSYRFLIGYHVK